MKTISIVNKKGGVGKTSFSINFGYELWREKKCVLFLDLDPQCDLTDFFLDQNEFDPQQKTILDILLNSENVDPMEALIEINENGLYIIPGSPGLAGFDLKYSEKSIKKFLAKDFLSEVDFVIIDFPPTLSESALAGLVASDEMLIMAEPESFSIKNLSAMKKELLDIKEKMNPALNLAGIITNKVDQRRWLTNRNVNEILNKNPEALQSYISIDSAFVRSAQKRIPLSCLNYYPRALSQLHDVMNELRKRGTI